MLKIWVTCSAYVLSLNSLPDISKWNNNNVNNMSYMFSLYNTSLNISDKFYNEEKKEKSQKKEVIKVNIIVEEKKARN